MDDKDVIIAEHRALVADQSARLDVQAARIAELELGLAKAAGRRGVAPVACKRWAAQPWEVLASRLKETKLLQGKPLVAARPRLASNLGYPA
jgi:hypothetical protein